jgi:hypothetical protein
MTPGSAGGEIILLVLLAWACCGLKLMLEMLECAICHIVDFIVWLFKKVFYCGRDV